MKFGVQNSSHSASFKRQDIWILFLLPAEACLPGKAGLLVLVPGLVTGKMTFIFLCLGASVCWREAEIFPSLPRGMKIGPKVLWSVCTVTSSQVQRSVVSWAFPLGKDALMGRHRLFQYLWKDHRNMEVLVCKECWRPPVQHPTPSSVVISFRSGQPWIWKTPKDGERFHWLRVNPSHP